MGRRAWGFTDGHNAAPFLIPPERGEIHKNSPARLAAKSATMLTERLLKGLDGDVLHLANDEWIRLKETWGTERVDEVQIMLMLGEGQSRTLIARSIYYAGLVGVTPCWHKLEDMREPRPYAEGEKHTLIRELRDYL